MVETGAGSFDLETLGLLDGEIEVDIETSAADRQAHRTTIWVVVADGVPLIRSWRGARGRWYREIRGQPLAAIHAAGRRIAVRAVPVDDAAVIEACSRALEAKYADDPSTPGMVAPEVLDTTLRLEPA